MTQNARVRLKEYTDAYTLPLPKYTFVKGGSQHAPSFETTVSVSVTGKYHQFVGDKMPTKKESHENAAEKAIQYLLKPGKNTIDPVEPQNKGKCVLLIDYENRPQFFNKMSTEQIESMDIYIFLYENHSLMDKPLPREHAHIITTDSSRVNGSDCCIQMYATVFLMENKYEKYIIATEDKFAYTLADYIKSDRHPWKWAEAQVVRDPSQLAC